MTLRPMATTTYLVACIETAVADAEYARLIGDTARTTQAIRQAVRLDRSLRRLQAVHATGSPVIVTDLWGQR